MKLNESYENAELVNLLIIQVDRLLNSNITPQEREEMKKKAAEEKEIAEIEKCTFRPITNENTINKWIQL